MVRGEPEGPAARGGATNERGDWLLHNRADYRQLGIVAMLWASMFSMYFFEECRHVLVFLAACYFAFLNAVVIHNHLHKGIFKHRSLNRLFKMVLSFGVLYPASANIASHNLVHHHFDDHGRADWAAPHHVSFGWNLLNLLHFPNVVGPNTFRGVSRWARTTRQRGFRRQYKLEKAFAFGLTGVLLLGDFWSALFFVIVPQLWGARGILRINLIQHDGCDVASEWNHSRNFVGKAFNWVMCNNGYHTIHHNRAGLHWSVLPEWHARECLARVDESLQEKSMVLFLLRTYLFSFRRAAPGERVPTDSVEGPDGIVLMTRAQRRVEAEREALVG